MQSRKVHAVGAFVIFFGLAKLYALATLEPLESGRLLLWSALGIGLYIALSELFGFDPHRTRLAAFDSPLKHYVERWELRLGQATLGMLGCIVMTAHFIDPAHFVSAVVCGTLAAWTYFALRLYRGGYKTAA